MEGIIADIVHQINKERLLGASDGKSVIYNGKTILYRIEHGIYNLLFMSRLYDNSESERLDASELINIDGVVITASYNKVYGIRSSMILDFVREVQVDSFCWLYVKKVSYYESEIRFTCKENTCFIVSGSVRSLTYKDGGLVISFNIIYKDPSGTAEKVLIINYKGEYIAEYPVIENKVLYVKTRCINILKELGYNPDEMDIKDYKYSMEFKNGQRSK